jgi:Protein of unknown function (DUF1194)
MIRDGWTPVRHLLRINRRLSRWDSVTRRAAESHTYEDCVIGGPGSFVVTIKDRDKFKEAIRTKLIVEVAGRTPERRIKVN